MSEGRAVNRPAVHTISAMSGPVGVAAVEASATVPVGYFVASADDHTGNLIDQTVNELCPAQIRQPRTSAASYRPPAP
jgi:hypothetical protein